MKGTAHVSTRIVTPAAFTTKDLQARLLESLNSDSIAARNSVARIGAVMIATKQLELNERARGFSEPVVLIDAV